MTAESSHTSIIEVSRAAIQQNLDCLREFLGPDIRISSVVKANAYGHGIEAFVPVAEAAGIDHFSVFSGDEARRVVAVKQPGTDVMIMGWMGANDVEWAVREGVDFFVFDLTRLEAAAAAGRKLRRSARVHLEVETGMNRTGLDRRQLKQAVELLNTWNEEVRVRGVCTHYAGAESIANHVRVQRQITRFERICHWLENHGIHPDMRHTACSAAAIAYPRTRMDMVRIGILQYGFWPTREIQVHYRNRRQGFALKLRRVLSWKSRIMVLKQVHTGEFISYGTSTFAEEDKLIAIIPVGYSHGYSRSLSNQGRVLIRERRAPVIGLVNMNMLLADVTGIPEVKAGDEVVLIGTQGDTEISLASFAEFNDQLNYELLARLPAETPRVVVKE
ncbi:MAG TPA: alanine racemase [Candidatus Aminicenantes bacterium]|nr:alanine racemase [Candidatus Aminicenantes bacterium]